MRRPTWPKCRLKSAASNSLCIQDIKISHWLCRGGPCVRPVGLPQGVPLFLRHTKKGPQLIPAGLPSNWRCSGTLCLNPPEGICRMPACTTMSAGVSFLSLLFQAVFTRPADGNYSFLRDSLLRQLNHRSELPYTV